MSLSNTTRVIAEYAKSGRSSCKTCSELIPSKSLRLGLVTRDLQRGFDLTKWHHLACFPNGTVSSAELISGFNLLQSGDKEALRKMVAEIGCNGLVDEVSNEGEEASGRTVNKTCKRDEDEQEIELEERNLKKIKFPATNPVVKESSAVNTGVNVDISFSLSDVSDKYKDALLPPKWKSYHTLIFLEQDERLHDSSKIAAFDFDGCLAKTSVRRVGADAWSLMYPSIPNKLQSLYDDGYKLVIFTNESNIERWKNKRQVAVDSKIGRLSNFIRLVQVPIQVFIACGYSDGKIEDPFRKPNPGMWQLMKKQFNSGVSVDMDKSFYVGDAAGRESDHSDADIKFAEAIGLKFYVPEDFFGA